MAIVLRDGSGLIIGRVLNIFSSSSAVLTEAFALRSDVRTAKRLNFRNVIFESNFKSLTNRILACNNSSWVTACVEKDILYETLGFDSCSFNFVSKNCNDVALWVARNTISGSCLNDWFVNIPLNLLSLL
ncbi:hypothetical protein V6N13_022922 [Hibiscus sabdariffa]|uniref:RNase H type-1 domain-containing protein n=2 Tax=Hibiscus sabdariffa TaxID=183260 RepID=A0ABR2P0J5_9ROSI